MNETKKELFSDLKLFLSFLFVLILIIIVSSLLWYLGISIEKLGLFFMILAIITFIILIPFLYFAYKLEEKKDVAPLTNYIGIYLILFMVFISILFLSLINLYFYYMVFFVSILSLIVTILNIYNLKNNDKETMNNKNFEMSK